MTNDEIVSLVGQDLGYFKVLEYLGMKHYDKLKRESLTSYFLVQCVCGTLMEKPVQELSRTRLRSCKSCKRFSTILRKELRRIYQKILVEHSISIQPEDNQLSTYKALYKQYFSPCGNYTERRKQLYLTNTIPFSLFKDLICLPCFYCGSLASNSYQNRKLVYNGLDRLDNTQGYTPENVVSCCKLCNMAKGKMTIKEFENWILSIVKHRNLEP